MIYGKDFVWIHLGKTGGTTLSHWASLCPEFVEYYDHFRLKEKHGPVPYQSKRFPHVDFSRKDIICGFRKIDSWIISHNNHHRDRILAEEGHTAWKRRTCKGLVIVPGKKTADWKSPDEWLRHYLSERKIKHFIRQEYLREDFIRVFQNYGLTHTQKIIPTKRNTGKYKKRFSFTEEQKQRIYKANPLWMSIQNKIYENEIILK